MQTDSAVSSRNTATLPISFSNTDYQIVTPQIMISNSSTSAPNPFHTLAEKTKSTITSAFLNADYRPTKNIVPALLAIGV